MSCGFTDVHKELEAGNVQALCTDKTARSLQVIDHTVQLEADMDHAPGCIHNYCPMDHTLEISRLRDVAITEDGKYLFAAAQAIPLPPYWSNF